MSLRLCAILATACEAVQFLPRTLTAAHSAFNRSIIEEGIEDGPGVCRVPQGQLLFLHIMKAGGTSIDSFLACHCNRVGCGMTLSLGPFRENHGHTNCPPALCSTHGDYRDRKELCGEEFANPAKVMTAFREPVSRVFSLFNYEIEQGHNLSSIANVYKDCDAEQQDENKPLGWLCAAMTNHVVIKTVADKVVPYSSKWDDALMKQAKDVVSSLDAIWFLEDFERFATSFGEASLVENSYTSEWANKPRCDVGHSNPTECPRCQKAPTAEEVELIKKHNEMDIALYNFAATLPNRMGQH